MFNFQIFGHFVVVWSDLVTPFDLELLAVWNPEFSDWVAEIVKRDGSLDTQMSADLVFVEQFGDIRFDIFVDARKQFRQGRCCARPGRPG